MATIKETALLAEEWTKIRAERDSLLTSSDWTQGSDSPLSGSKKTEWATYRTLLRDLPVDQSSKIVILQEVKQSPSETASISITWPPKPE